MNSMIEIAFSLLLVCRSLLPENTHSTQPTAQKSTFIRYSWEILRGNLQFADICKVDKRCFLGPYSYNLRRLHDKFSFFSSYHIWIFFPHDVKYSIKQLQKQGFTSI